MRPAKTTPSEEVGVRIVDGRIVKSHYKVAEDYGQKGKPDGDSGGDNNFLTSPAVKCPSGPPDDPKMLNSIMSNPKY